MTFNAKLFFKTPLDKLSSNGFEVRPQDEEFIQSLHSKHFSVSRKLKALNNEKREIASEFKNLNGNETALSHQKQAMQGVSARIKATEGVLKEISASAKKLFDARDEKSIIPFPAFFDQPTRMLNREIAISIETISSEHDWYQFFQQHIKVSNSSQSPYILETISKSFGYKNQVIVARSGSEIVGGLPIVLINSKLFGNKAVSTPYFNYGGVLSSYRDVTTEILASCSRLVENGEIPSEMELRTTWANIPLPCSQKKVSMVLRLPKSNEELSRNLGTKIRAQINKAKVHQPHTSIGGTELLNDFYAVFATNMRDLGTPVYSKKWFENLLNTNGIFAKLVVCYVSGKPVSAGFLLGHQTMLEIPWASTLKRANAMNMNMWMYRQILDYAISKNYSFFDFGRSTFGANTFKFKKQWGAEPIQHYWYYVNSTNSIGETNPDNPKFKLLINLWQILPVWFTKIIGPWIVKQIP